MSFVSTQAILDTWLIAKDRTLFAFQLYFPLNAARVFMVAFIDGKDYATYEVLPPAKKNGMPILQKDSILSRDVMLQARKTFNVSAVKSEIPQNISDDIQTILGNMATLIS